VQAGAMHFIQGRMDCIAKDERLISPHAADMLYVTGKAHMRAPAAAADRCRGISSSSYSTHLV
jgi:hypothetical protein